MTYTPTSPGCCSSCERYDEELYSDGMCFKHTLTFPSAEAVRRIEALDEVLPHRAGAFYGLDKAV